jgi:hypothetical protein
MKHRKSVPTAGVHRWWLAGWSFVMVDPNNKQNCIIEWLGKEPAGPVSEDESFEVVR